MENQHREIKGYRELDADEIALMNEVKAKGAELGGLVRAHVVRRARAGGDVAGRLFSRDLSRSALTIAKYVSSTQPPQQ